MTHLFKLTGVLSMVGLTVILCGFDATQTCNNQPDHTGRDIALAGVAVGAVVVTSIVLVHNHNASHRLQGCVSSGPDGLKIVTNDNKSYSLGGDVADLKVGNKVKIHGSKVKRDKAATGDQTFTVEKLNKDYGACKMPAPMAGASPAPPAAM